MPGVIIIGAGPGIGIAVARRFAREGLPIAVLARSATTVDPAVAALAGTEAETLGKTADAADETALRAALDHILDRFGLPDVLVYNAAIIQWDAIGELNASAPRRVGGQRRRRDHRCGARRAPDGDRGRGTIVITGGMPTPIPEVTSLSPRPACALSPSCSPPSSAPQASTSRRSLSTAPPRPARRSTQTE